MKKVYIGVGHGGQDSGAYAPPIKEKDLNLGIALALGAELQRHGVEVMLSRTTDVYEDVNAKVAECNKFAPDLCLDVHNNAGGGDGFEVYHYTGGGTSLVMAQNIEKEVIAIGQNSRGCKTKLGSDGKDYFGFIRMTKSPAVLVECAFVDTKDVQIVDTSAEQKSMGIAIAKGILKTLGIAYIPEVAPVQPVPVQPAIDYLSVIASKDLEIARLNAKINNAKTALN